VLVEIIKVLLSLSRASTFVAKAKETAEHELLFILLPLSEGMSLYLHTRGFSDFPRLE
jgi:hypothetical protein